MIKPRYNDGMTEHPYCGRTCANLAKGQRPVNGNPPVPPKPVINTTNPTPRNNRRSLYRTRTGITSTSFAASSVNTPNPFTVATTDPTQSANSRNSALAPTNSTRGRGNRSSVHWGLSSGQLCQTPGCGSPVHVNQNGFAGKYCTKVHQQYVSPSSIIPHEGVPNHPQVWRNRLYILSGGPNGRFVRILRTLP